jgi:hypothetical protein
MLTFHKTDLPEVVRKPGRGKEKVDQAALLDKQIKAASKQIVDGKVSSWQGLVNIGIATAENYASIPFTSENIKMCFQNYKENTLTLKATAVVAKAPAIITKAEAISNASKYTYNKDYTPRPQQVQAVEQLLGLYDQFRRDPEHAYHAAFVTMGGGQGKTVVAAIFMRHLQDKYPELAQDPMSIFYMTDASMVQDPLNSLPIIGVKGTDVGAVQIVSHGALSTQMFKDMFLKYDKDGNVIVDKPSKDTSPDDDEDEDVGKTRIDRYQWMYKPPAIVILDEADRYKKPTSKKSKMLMSWIREKKTFFVFMTFTPGSCMRDLTIFFNTLNIQSVYNRPMTDLEVTGTMIEINKNKYLTEDNNSAMMRVRERFPSVFINPPVDRSKYKLICNLKIEDFVSQTSKEIYFNAEQSYLEAAARTGRSISDQTMKLVRHTILQMAEETAKLPLFLKYTEETLARGRAPIIGMMFQETIRNYVLECHKRGIIPRDKMCLIWGGSKPIQQKDIFTNAELDEWMVKMAAAAEENYTGPQIPANIYTKFAKTKQYYVMRTLQSLSKDAYNEKTEEIIKLGLVNQTPVKRYWENQDFLDGKRIGAVVSLGAGSRGISLDHQRKSACPRSMFTTLCYEGPKFAQALRRPHRVVTLSDTELFIIFLKGTIGATHVAPKLEPRLRALHTIATGRTDYIGVLEKSIKNGEAKEISSTHNQEGITAEDIAEVEATDTITADMDEED